MDIRRLAINNNRRVVEAFKEILSDLPTRPEASNDAVLDLPGPEASNNAVLDLSGPDSSSSTPKGLLGNNTRLSNSQKKKATQQILVGRLKNKASTSKRAKTPTPLPAAMELIRPGKRNVRVTANAVESTPTKQLRQVVD